jgi:hypothetical protein
VRDRVRVVVDRGGVESADQAVVHEHVGRRDHERQPVLVHRQDHDHHEEEEVSLDRPVPDVHEERRLGCQADRDQDGGPAAVLFERHRRDDDRHHDGEVGKRMERAEALDEAEDGQADPLNRHHPDEGVMPA